MDNIKKLLQSIENYEKHFKIKAYYMAFALSYDSDDEAEVLVGIASKEQIEEFKKEFKQQSEEYIFNPAEYEAFDEPQSNPDIVLNFKENQNLQLLWCYITIIKFLKKDINLLYALEIHDDDIKGFKEKIEDGYLNEEGLKLYSQTQIKERNETFEVEEYLKNFILIGDDSGGLGFLLDKDGKVYSCDLGVLDEDDMELQASSLEEFICLVS